MGSDGRPSSSSSSTLGVMETLTARAAAGRVSATDEAVQAERRSSLHRGAATTASPPPRSGGATARPATAPGASPAGGGATKASWKSPNETANGDGTSGTTQGLFATKLKAMHKDMYETRKDSNLSMRAERKSKLKLQERRQLLRFREVDDELDSLILKRDLFLWLRTMRLGQDHVIDQLLERDLRFYPSQSNREVAYNPKLFTGHPFLMNGPPFPTLQKLTRMSSVGAMVEKQKQEELNARADARERGEDEEAAIARLPRLDTESQSAKRARASKQVGGYADTAAKRAKLLYLGTGDDKGGVLLNRTMFAKPTLVTLSQLTFSTGAQCYEDEWIRLLRPDAAATTSADAAAGAADGSEGASVRAVGKPKGARASASNFNVMTLKSIETTAAQWLRAVVIPQYCKGLNVQAAKETLFGDKLVRQFMPAFGLRNYSTTYCFLVDSSGNVRWMSAGLPDEAEKTAFPALLRELEMDYLRKL